MAEMEDRLNAILGNPQMMQQIMSMAQTLGQTQSDPPKQEQKQPDHSRQTQNAAAGEIAALGSLVNLAKKAGIDKNQQALLKALHPYLNKDRIAKLEKAMRAAKMAAMASSVLGSSGLSFLSGR